MLQLVAGLVALVTVSFFGSSKRRYPPGPPAKPLIGNILDVSPQGAWTKFTEHNAVYGDLVFFHELGNNILVLNSMKAINDLLEKRGSIYSDRPSFTVVGDLMGLGQSMPLLPCKEVGQTYSTVLTCIMAMALYPDKQRKAQAELDEVVGMERMQKISDKASLPYVNALIKETMRWYPALPLSIARCISEDDIYEGYTIPKGTIVMPNVWAIAFSKLGPYDLENFVPERFLETTTGETPIDPITSWAFGFALRICLGKALGENSVFILIATLLSMFDIPHPMARTSSRVRERTGQLSGAVQVQDHTAVAVESGAGSLEGEPIRCVDRPSSKFLPRTPVSVGQMVIVFELDANEKEPRWMKCRHREVESRASGTLRPNVDVGLKAPPKASVAPAATGRIRMDGLVPPVR